MKDAVAIVILAIVGLGAFAAFCAPFYAFGYYLERWECSSKARAMSVPYSFGPIQGCMVTYKGHVVPLEAVRAVDQ